MVLDSTENTGPIWRESRTEGNIVNIHGNNLEQSAEIGTTHQFENVSQTLQKCDSALM